jgi:hypothetical protein
MRATSVAESAVPFAVVDSRRLSGPAQRQVIFSISLFLYILRTTYYYTTTTPTHHASPQASPQPKPSHLTTPYGVCISSPNT